MTSARGLLADSGVEIDIIDVGHGSCVALHARGTVTLIDTGPSSAVLEYLAERDINKVDLVVLSHADQDHIGGLSAMLSNRIEVRRVLWNTDGMKHSRIFKDLCYQLDELEDEGKTVAQGEAPGPSTIKEVADGLRIEILAPRTRLRRLGVGNEDRLKQRIESNSVSVVVRVLVDDEPVLVIPGDLDTVGLSHLTDPSWPPIDAKYLLLPHHGGRMSPKDSVTQDAVQRLVEAVNPEAVFVSNGRRHFYNPRTEVVAGVRAHRADLPIVCTQLSKACSPTALLRSAAAAVYSNGWATGESCAGTVRITNGQGSGASTDLSEHAEFLRARVSSPRCAVVDP